MERCLTDARRNNRGTRDRLNWEALIFYQGGESNQWSVWDRGANGGDGAFVPRGDDPERGGLPAWMPRCVSNKFATKIDGIAAILNQSEPAYQWAPATDDEDDRATAETCGDAVPALWEEAGYVNGGLRTTVNHLVTLIDRVAVVVYFDADARHGKAPIPLLQCTSCETLVSPSEAEQAAEGTCPSCGAAEALTIALDEQGAEIGLPYPIGRLCADVIPSFEFSIPSSARDTDTERLPWVLTHSRLPVEEALRLWPKARDIILGAAGNAPTSGVGRVYADAMRRLSAGHGVAGSLGQQDTQTVLVYRLQHDPIQDDEFDLPDGLHAVRIGEEIVFADALPVKDERGRAIKSVLVRTFQRMPGTSVGKPPGDDLVPLQKIRNMLQTLTICIGLQHAAPRTFIPLSVSLEDVIEGVPGEQVRYSSTVPGERPFTEAGTNPPEGLFRLLEMNDAEFEEVSRLNAVLAGERPEGDPTLGEVRILQERGIAAFSTPLAEMMQFEKQLARLCLRVARDSLWHPRFRKVKGDNGEWEVRQFTAADLAGNVDVYVEASSAWPKSPLMQLLALEKAITLQVLPAPSLDPELQQQALLLMNLASMKPSMDRDRKQVVRKLDRFTNAQTPDEILATPPDPIAENLLVHRVYLTLWLRTEEAEEMQRDPARAPIYAAIRQHIAQIEQILAQQQAAQLAAAQPPDTRTAVERGDTSELERMVNEGVLQPEGTQAGGADLDELLAGGVLTPAAESPAGAVP